MRKLILSVCVIAASAAYVAKTAMSQDSGVQGLVDRVSFRASKAELPPLDLGDPLVEPAPASAVSADQSAIEGALPSLTFTPPADLGPALRDDTPLSVTRSVATASAAPSVPLQAPPSPPSAFVIPPMPRLAPQAPQIALASPQPAPGPTPAPAATVPSTLNVAPPPTGKYHDGTFTGSVADAYFGLVQVRARVTGGKVTGIDVLRYPADRRTSRSINSYALPLLEREAVVAQDAHVHIISGATLTAAAYIESLDTALRQAL